MVNVLFVCMGNICRSPMAQAAFEKLLRQEGLEDEISVDSAGTGSWHVGQPPDTRAQESAARRNLDLAHQRARQVTPEDCRKFDYLIVMDRDNHQSVSALCRGSGPKARLFLEFAESSARQEVPDPYYGGPDGFERALDLVEEAARGLLDEIRRRDLEGHV
ncbi:MAG: low molecular weight protein-tyrosine-phosphatase [Rubrobacteraceae bacterium]